MIYTSMLGVAAMLNSGEGREGWTVRLVAQLDTNQSSSFSEALRLTRYNHINNYGVLLANRFLA